MEAGWPTAKAAWQVVGSKALIAIASKECVGFVFGV
jgi:hypothetical protein